MASVLQKIVGFAHKTFSKSSQGDFQKTLIAFIDDMSRVSCDDIEFDKRILQDDRKFDLNIHHAPVTYVHLCENAAFSAGVFIVRNGERLPLHDHPKMYGVIKVIHGRASVQCYTEVPDSVVPDYVSDTMKPTYVKPWQQNKIIQVAASPQHVLDASSEPCVLTPTESNFHEIKALGGVTAFFDVLFPPYDQITGSRLCKYYKPIWPTTREERSKNLCEQYLLEISQPMDFWCDHLPYTGPDLGQCDT